MKMLIPLLLIVGCNPTIPEKYFYTKQEVEDGLQKYVNCMRQAAMYYSKSDSTTYEIADAAHSRCDREFGDYQEGIEQYMMDRASNYDQRIYAERRARDLAQGMKKEVRMKVVQWVIDARLTQ